MFDTIAPRYDLVNRIMTFRIDVGWRRETRDALWLDPGLVTLDLASGTGDFCVDLAKGGHRPIGVDLSYGILAAARTDALLVQGDLLNLPMPDRSVDAAVCGFALRNLVSLPPFVAELQRVVRPGGRICATRRVQAGQSRDGVGAGRLFQQGRSARWRRPVGSERLCLPTEVRVLLAATGGDARHAGGGRPDRRRAASA